MMVLDRVFCLTICITVGVTRGLVSDKSITCVKKVLFDF